MIEGDIGEIKDTLEAYKSQFDVVRKDLALLIKHSGQAQNSILSTSIQSPSMRFTPSEIEECKRFVEKYGVRVG